MKDKRSERVFKPRKERVTLNERMLPDVKNLRVGEETTIEIKVKVVAVSEGSEYGGFEEDSDWRNYLRALFTRREHNRRDVRCDRQSGD